MRNIVASLQEKAQWEPCCLGDANVCRSNNRAVISAKLSRFWILCNKQCRKRITQINPIQTAIDLHRFTQLCRAIRQVPPVADQTMRSEVFFTKCRFQSADQHCFRDPCGPAYSIYTKMIPIDEIYVTMPRQAEQHSVSSSRSGKSVAGGITVQIGFCLNYHTAAWSSRRIPDKPMAKQLRGDRFSRWMV